MDQYLTKTDTLTRDCIDSLAALYPQKYRTLNTSHNGGVLIRRNLPEHKVRLIVSSGGGCYPLSAGYLSKELADASVNGNIRSAPSAYDIYETAKAIGRDKGSILIYNNFMGDYLNNDLACELLHLENIESRLCPCTDDCLSVPAGTPRHERTGLTGLLYLLKIGSVCVRKGLTLDETHRILLHANDRISSVTITFDFHQHAICLGNGFSGEPPVLTYPDRFHMSQAASTVYDLLTSDLLPQSGNKLSILVSRLEQTRCEEAYIFTNEIRKYASHLHQITDINIDYYTYLLNTHGFFVSMLCVDDILQPFWIEDSPITL
ncbi:MAG: dihydroxyacetone kinase subunit DhaK [Eubacteriales bacterium]|nr:dihydroxyacetone kinase subunit DhaK [Eubacteriales bacterium]